MADESGIPSNMAPDATAIPRALTTADRAQALRRTHPVKTDLESWVLEGIGKIIVLWAHEEWLLTGIALRLMGMDRKKGRKVLSGRAEDAMKKIRSCLARRKMKAPKGLKNVARQVSDLAEIRNRVGHGIWMNHSDTGQVMLQRITGVWEVNGKVVDTKRHTPEGQKVTTQWLAEQVDKIHKCIEDTAALSTEVNAALS